MKDKKGLMKLSHFAYGVLFIGIFMIAFSGMIASLNSSYNMSIDSSFGDTFNKINEMGNLTNNIQDKVVGAEVEEADPSGSISTMMLNALKLILDIPSIIIQFFKELFFSSMIPIDPQIQVALLAIIILTIAFLIIGLIYGDKV